MRDIIVSNNLVLLLPCEKANEVEAKHQSFCEYQNLSQACPF